MKFKHIALSMISVMAISSFSFAGTSPLSGTVNSPLWLGSDQLVVKVTTEMGTAFHKLGLNGAHEVILKDTANATELVQTPDGKKVAYVNDNGDLFLMDLITKTETKLSIDNEPKFELQFNEAGTKLYFLFGEKIDKIGVINLADSKQTTLLSDAVAYKSEMKVSGDDSKVVYTVTKAGKVDETNEAYTVDSKGTEPQIFQLDLMTTGAKPVQLTTDTDNKVNVNLLKDNSAVYVSVNPDKEGLPLKWISADGKESKYFVNHLEVLDAEVLKDGTVLVIGSNIAYKKALFVVDSKGTTTKLATLPEGATDISGMDLGHIVITQDTEDGEKISLVQNGKLVDLSK